MAEPYLIFKAHTGFYCAQIRLADGTLSNNKSTGCKNRAEAERKVMEWIVTENIPVRVNSKNSKVQSIDKIRLFNDLRATKFDSDDINNTDFEFVNPKYHEGAVDTRKMEAVLKNDGHCKTKMIELKKKILKCLILK